MKDREHLKHIFIFSLLPILFCPTAWAADTQISGPGFVTAVDDGRIHISPAVQLPINLKPPVACSPETRGTFAVNGNTRLCICDGQGWKIANTDEACAWTPAPR